MSRGAVRPNQHNKPTVGPDYGAALNLRSARGEPCLVTKVPDGPGDHVIWLETTLIDHLYRTGLLGLTNGLPDEDAARRKSAGESMRGLFHKAGRGLKAPPMDGVPIQQAGLPKDISYSSAKAFDRYINLIRNLGKHSSIAQDICCYDRMPRIGLKALLEAMDQLAAVVEHDH